MYKRQINEFYIVKGYRRKECKKCANRIRQEDRNKKRKELKAKAIQYLGGKCQKCGYDKCSGALEFHHKNRNEKDKAIHELLDKPNWEKLEKELKKCVLVCANCHREIHARKPMNLFDSDRTHIKS